MIREYLESNKQNITSYLESFFARKAKELTSMGPAGADTLDRLLSFTSNGKMIRGSCVNLGYSLFRENDLSLTLPIAAAVELFQSALLIHDDIMDRDETRRGFPSLYYQFQQAMTAEALPDTLHTGQSLAICAGDIAFFLGYELLGTVPSQEMGMALLEYASKELSNVAVAQMVDVRRGVESAVPKEEEIINLYRHKTGRYTFSLPLWMGARLGGADESTLSVLEIIGELLGILFQIRDDELGLFGDEQVLGKPVGSDFREGKKTLHLTLLYRFSSPDERKELAALQEKEVLTRNDMSRVRDYIKRLSILDYIENEYTTPLRDELNRHFQTLDSPRAASKDLLASLIDFINQRDN